MFWNFLSLLPSRQTVAMCAFNLLVERDHATLIFVLAIVRFLYASRFFELLAGTVNDFFYFTHLFASKNRDESILLTLSRPDLAVILQ